MAKMLVTSFTSASLLSHLTYLTVSVKEPTIIDINIFAFYYNTYIFIGINVHFGQMFSKLCHLKF